MSLKGANVAIFCDFKFEDLEVMYPKLRLEEEGATVHVIGVHPKGMKYVGKHGYPCKSDLCVDAFDPKAYHALILPGGTSLFPFFSVSSTSFFPYFSLTFAGFAPDYMRRSQRMLDGIVAMMEAGKPCAAICHGPWMFCSARKSNGDPVIKGKKATCFHAIKDDVINAGATYVADQTCVVDGNLITAQTPSDLGEFCKAIIRGLKA